MGETTIYVDFEDKNQITVETKNNDGKVIAKNVTQIEEYVPKWKRKLIVKDLKKAHTGKVIII